MSGKDSLPACLSLNQAKKKTAQRAGEQADKKTGGCFPSVYLSVRSSFERGILRADKSRPRSSILYGLARGKTQYERKRSAPCLSVVEPSPKKDRASGVRTSRQKTTAFFAVVCLSVRSSFERGILRADESRPRSSIPFAVLARGKTKYARKRSAQNLALTPLARSKYLGIDKFL